MHIRELKYNNLSFEPGELRGQTPGQRESLIRGG